MRFLSLAERNMKEIYRDPVSVLLGVAMPAVLLTLFSSIAKNAPVDLFTVSVLTPGVIVFSFAFLVMFSAMLLSKDRQSAFLTRLLTSPLTTPEFILAYSLPFIPLAAVQATICYLVAILLGLSVSLNLLISFIVLIPAAIVCIGIGILMGSIFSENQVAGVGSIVVVTISLFSGAWMDLRMVGGVFEKIGYSLPFAHAVDSIRFILAGNLDKALTDLYWVIGYAVVFFFLAVIALRKKTSQ